LAVTNIKLSYVHQFRDRHDKSRYYFRRHGKRTPLPGVPGSAEFMAAYQVALDGAGQSGSNIGAGRITASTINAMVIGFLTSGAFEALRLTSQQQYRRIFEGLRREHGAKRMKALERRHVVAMLDAKAKTPVAARDFLRCLRLLVKYAIGIGVRDDDPTAGVTVKIADTGGFKTWSEPEIATFEAKFPVGSKPRLALAMLLYTVQRCADVVRFGQSDVRNGELHFVQQKDRKRKPMTIPVRLELQAILAATPTIGIGTFLVNERGQPFTARSFSKWFKACCRAAGLGHLSAHGLRKAAMRRMAEAGYTAPQIAAWSGHESLREITRYIAAANRAHMARAGLETERKQASVANLAAEGGKPDEKCR
jgi:integrase